MELYGYIFKQWATTHNDFIPSLIAVEANTGRDCYLELIEEPVGLNILAMSRSRFWDIEDQTQNLIELKVLITDEDDGRILTKTIGCYVLESELVEAITSGQHDDLWAMWESTCLR